MSRGHAALKHALQSHNRTLQLARYQTVDDVVNRFDFIQSREYRPSSPVHGDRATGRRFPATLSGHPAAARGHKVQMRSKLETSFAISLCLSSRGPVTVLFLHIFRSLVMSNASQGFIPVNSVILLVHLSLNKLHGFCSADNATTVLFSGNFALDPPPSVLPPFPGILAPDRHSDLQVLTSYHIVV